MAYVKAQFQVPQLVDVNGDTAVGYKIHFFLTGTSTRTPVYSDSSGTALSDGATTGVVAVNSAGLPQTAGGTVCDIYLDTKIIYKYQIYDASGSAFGPTVDPYYPLGLNSHQTVNSFATAYGTAFTGIEIVNTESFYDYTPGTDTPKGGATYHRDGATGTASTAYSDNSGFYDTNGDGFSINIDGIIDLSCLGLSASSSASVNSTAINNAISIATASASATFYASTGGLDIVAGSGVFEIDSEHVIPAWVNLLGKGKGLTVFKCTTAGSMIRFGTKAGAFDSGQRGGKSGGFTVDGDSLSSLGLLIGFVVEREFHDIDVVNCKGASNGDGIVLQAAQNCNFVGVGSQHNGGTSGSGSNIVIDYGAGNNRFYGSEINRPGEYNVKFIQSGTSPSGAFGVPTGNRFYGPMIERWEDQDGGGTVTALGAIYHGAGRENYFESPDFSLTGLPSALPIITQRKDGSGASTLLTFHNAKFHGTATYSVAVDVDGVANCRFTGVTFFENHGTVFKVGDSSAVHVIGEIVDSSGGTFFANQSGGVKTQDELVYFEMPDIVAKYNRSSASDDAIAINVSGESFSRIQIKPNGINLGTGSGATDVTISRDSAASTASLKTNTALFELGAAGIVVVTGVPTIGVPDGWIAIRTDGTSGSVIYHRESSAWVAIA